VGHAWEGVTHHGHEAAAVAHLIAGGFYGLGAWYGGLDGGYGGLGVIRGPLGRGGRPW
jgi:hypothetical protein